MLDEIIHNKERLTMSHLRIVKCAALPLNYTQDTLYLVKAPTSPVIEVYVSSNDGESISHVSTMQDILEASVAYSPTPPEFPCAARFWWDTSTGALFVQYDDGLSSMWVEAMPSIAVPEFGGNGEAETMARSDHWHEGVLLMKNEW